MTGFDRSSDESGRADASQAAWFHDESSVLMELKRVREAEAPPPTIRGYTDFRELQRGGQGIVYRAVQRSTNRTVAVKVLLDRFGTVHAVRKRFEREIDMIASLRHPNIVRVYDSGVADDGRLYLVMDYIDGVPLDEFVAARDPSEKAHGFPSVGFERDPRDIVSLFITVGRAVNYAHQRGIIHRDLKPSNIRIDEQGNPHILDFGLAKITAADGEPVPRSSLSISGQILGSVPWASPEQADGRPHDVDVRSDIYALGVMLYHAITGRMPYDVESGLRQTLTNILEAEPSRPSVIRRDIDRDLETILLKALAKDPSRRYQSAEAFIGDLEHWLAGEPISARRDSTWYMVSRTARKHRLAAISIVVVMMLLVALTAVLAILYQRAAASEQLAEERLVRVQHEAERAERERERAERRFREVRELANQFIFDVHDEIEPLAGSRPARELLVTTALEYLSSLAEEADDDDALQLDIAAAYRRIGDIQGNPFSANLGDSAGALKSYETALNIQEATLRQRGEDAELQREIADLTNVIGDMHQWMGRRDSALKHYARARDLLEPLHVADPENRNIQRILAAIHIKRGDTLQWMNDPDAVLAEFEAGLKLLAELARHPEGVRDLLNHAVAHGKVGFALGYNLGRHEEALEHHTQAFKITESVVEMEPDNAHALRAVSINANQVGATLIALKRYDEAANYHARSLAIAMKLYDADQGNVLAASDLSFTHNKIGELHTTVGDSVRALEHFHAALDLRRQLADHDPENASFQRDLATSYGLVAGIHESMADAATRGEERRQHRQHAIDAFETARDIMLDLRERGMLGEVDAARPEYFAEQVTRLRQRLDK